MVWTPFTRANHDRSRQRYASDMTDREWCFIAPFMPGQPLRGRKRKTDLRSVVAAIFYVLQSGCQWSLLPKDFPPKSTVHDYFVDWHGDRTLARIYQALYVECRKQAGKQPSPTLAIVDSQSVKSAEKGGSALIRLDMTQARKLKARNGTMRWIRSA